MLLAPHGKPAAVTPYAHARACSPAACRDPHPFMWPYYAMVSCMHFQECADAREKRAAITHHVNQLLGTDGVLLLPVAPGAHCCV